MDSASVDLIYLDPPFNKNDTFITKNNKQIAKIKRYFINEQYQSNRFIGVDFEEVFKENTASFKDIWNENDIHRRHYTELDGDNNGLVPYLDSIKGSVMKGGFYYLIYMAIRLVELHRVLKETGSLYLHCDPTLSHYLKAVMDRIFGHDNFRNEIVWGYRTGGISQKRFARKHDVILCYGKSQGRTFHHALQERIYYEKPFIETLRDAEGRYYADVYVRDVWDDIKPVINVSKERVGYPTQKPLALLERIIRASSRAEDWVLDPFCGCATACVASERLGRRWIGIDINPQAYYMVYYREMQLGVLGTEATPGLFGSGVIKRVDIPVRTDLMVEERDALERERQALEDGKQAVKRKRKRLSEKEKAIAKELLYEEQAGICEGCDSYLRTSDLTLDHITPQSKEGEDDLDNLQLLCYRCNVWKGTGKMFDLIEKLWMEKVIPHGVYQKQVKKLKQGSRA